LATQLVRPQDPVRLAEVIAATIRNPVQSKAVGATALNRFRNEYSMDAMLSAYADLYSACVSMPR
jgi:glycosyltransferase involved in cell wall biosynthesis